MPDRTRVLLCGAAVALWAPLATASPPAAQLAFPGAIGYGREAIGWRGGEIVPITNLDDSGPGSLRACAEAEGPRVCIFRVSGTIIASEAILVRSNVYIAGQTAPGDGIQIRTEGGLESPIIIKDAEDVVIRFLKVRPGPSSEPSPGVDAVTVENARRVYLDHLSLAFATDETFNIHSSSGLTADITLANSLLAFSLDHSTHTSRRHSKGALICSFDAATTGCGRITLWGNLFAHHRDRNPEVNGDQTGPVEIVNNVFYDPISQFGEYYNHMGNTQILYVGNVTMPGPSTMEATPPAAEIFLLGGDNAIEITARDNLAFAKLPCQGQDPGLVLGPQAELLSTDTVEASPGLPEMPVAGVVESVLAAAGDVLHRDALDELAVRHVRRCKGHVIDRPDGVGGWPELTSSEAPPDTDGDGLPDDWEMTDASLGPDHADLWEIDPGTGLSRFETYLATLAGDI